MTPIFTTPSGQVIQLDQVLGEGGEGEIWSVKGRPEAAKVYHPSARGREKERKLKVMVSRPPRDDMLARYAHHSIAWPTELVNEDGGFAGFLMPRLARSHKILEIYNPRLRRSECPGFNWKYLMHTAYNLSVALDAVHARGYIIGDINEGNILVTSTALVSLIDTDSFQVRDEDGRLYRCPVGKEDFTPPELQGLQFNQVDRLPEHDYFGLAVLIFMLLMEGNHPFSGEMKMDWPSGEPSHIYALKRGAFPYANNSLVKRRPTAPLFRILPQSLQRLFLRAFVEGYSHPGRRPSAGDWAKALEAAEAALVRCKRQPDHYYSKHLGDACPWCQREPAAQPAPARAGNEVGNRLQTPLPPTPMKPVPPGRTPPATGGGKSATVRGGSTGGGKVSVGAPTAARPGSASRTGAAPAGGAAALTQTGPSRPRYSSLPPRVLAQLSQSWASSTARQPAGGYHAGLSRREWWRGIKAPILWGMGLGASFALLVLVMFSYTQVTSTAGGLLAGLAVTASALVVVRFCFTRLERARQRLGISIGLLSLVGGLFLAYLTGVWGAHETMHLLQAYLPQPVGLVLNGIALGGVAGAVTGNFRLFSRAYSRVAGLLTSLAVAIPPIVLLALTGFFELAFKAMK